MALRISTGERMESELRDAAWGGDSATVARLISLGAKIYLTDDEQNTPLIVAAREGHSEVVKQLLQARAQVDLENERGNTALIEAAWHGNSAVVQQLLQAGAQIDHANYEGETALIWAARKGHFTVVRQLLQACAKVDHANFHGSTALIKAVTYNKSSVVEQLLKANAKVDHADKDETTALMLAARYGYHEVVNHLLTYGANVKLKDNKGSTACIQAIQEGWKEIARRLSTAAADLEKSNNVGGSALSLHSDRIQVGTKRHLTDPQARPSKVRVQSDCSKPNPRKPSAVLSKRINNKKDAIDAVNDKNGVDLAVTDAEKVELRGRFNILATLSTVETVSAQEAIPELHYTLEKYLKLQLEAEDVPNAVIKYMNRKGRMSFDALCSSYSDVKKKYPATQVSKVPSELHERFRSAASGSKLLKIIAKPVLCALFQDSGSTIGNSVSFRRTREAWDESEVNRLLTEHGMNDTLIDEEGFIEVGMKILFGDRSAAS